jgi:four helix bundle protein
LPRANGAISQADFRAKMSIAYKECLETKYWLSLLKDTNYIEERAFQSINDDAEEVVKCFGLFANLPRNTKNQKPITDN